MQLKLRAGFLQSWLANGLKERVVGRVKEVFESADVDEANVKVLVTGEGRCGGVGAGARGSCMLQPVGQPAWGGCCPCSRGPHDACNGDCSVLPLCMVLRMLGWHACSWAATCTLECIAVCGLALHRRVLDSSAVGMSCLHPVNNAVGHVHSVI